MSGRLMGPLLRCSGLAVGEDGAVLGAVLVNGTPGEPPFGGPWISQVFRHPDAPGVGGALLRRALAIATRDGLPAIGLAVTHANPAMRASTRRSGSPTARGRSTSSSETHEGPAERGLRDPVMDHR